MPFAEKEVIKTVEVPVEVEKIVEVEVPVETIIYKDKVVEVEKKVEVEVEVAHRYAQTNCVNNNDGTYTVTFTCTAEGCNDSYTVVVGDVEVHEHNYVVAKNVDATCTADGSVTYACACGSTYTDVVKATGHQWNAWSEKTAATTTANAVEGRTCATCGLEETREVSDSMLHVCNFNETVREAATCTADGFVKSACTCGETKVDVVKALGHDWTEWQSISTFSSFDKIMEVRECLTCGDYENRETAIDHVHSYNFVIGSSVEPTCENAGKEMDKECICGDLITGNVIDALGHCYEVVDGTSVDATCEAVGKVSDKKCANCGDVITGEEIAALGHAYNVVVDTDATCTENGSHIEECANCGNRVEETENALGHAWGEFVYNNDATEMADGTETRCCANCGEEQTQTAEGTKISVDWKGRTYISIDEFHWGYYTDDNGVLQCGSVENCRQYLAAKYPFLTVYVTETAVWAE
jgi:Zn ribbon nucleic-acid-binding protein